jgi:hypothetical protein
VHGEPVLVDEARADQAVREPPAAEGDDVLSRLALEPRDLLLHRRLGEASGVPLDLRAAASQSMTPSRRATKPSSDTDMWMISRR